MANFTHDEIYTFAKAIPKDFEDMHPHVSWLRKAGAEASDSEVKRVLFSQDARSACVLLDSWHRRGGGGESLDGSQMRGLNSLLTLLEGQNHQPGGIRKGLALFGMMPNDGQFHYRTRKKLEECIQVYNRAP
jgi:hypothetical protein